MAYKPDPIRNILQRAGFTIFATIIAAQIPMFFLPSMTLAHPLEGLMFTPSSILIYSLVLFEVGAVAMLYYYWRREKRALMEAQREELAQARREATVETLQKTAAVIVERIGAPNAEALKWVNARQAGGNQVSLKVENSARSIAAAVRDLTELAFVRPYASATRNDENSLPMPSLQGSPEGDSSRSSRILSY